MPVQPVHIPPVSSPPSLCSSRSASCFFHLESIYRVSTSPRYRPKNAICLPLRDNAVDRLSPADILDAADPMVGA